MTDLRIGFVMSTEVGWRTQFLNWQQCLSAGLGVEPEWIVISWWKPDGFLERLPGVPRGVKARIRSRLELYQGLAKGPFDALYVSVGHTLHGAKPFLSRQPYFIATDVTPLQLHAFGDIYGITRTRFDWYERQKHRGWQERYRAAAGLFACSHWAAESMAADYGAQRERIHVIPPGIDLAQWEFAARERGARPAQLLFVGGDFRRKGGQLLLDWARTTTARDWELHLVTRDRVESGDARIKVYNHLSANDLELRRLYRQADVFVLPTLGDCYSIASIEAMASGVPVILSRTGGTADILREDETGHLIAPGDGRALATRLERLLADPVARERMGCAARADVEARFDARKNIEQTIALMRAHIGAPAVATGTRGCP